MFLPSPRRLAVIAAVVTALSIPLTGASPVIEVDKSVALETETVTARVTLPRDRDDSMFCIGWVRYYTYRYRDGTLEERDESMRSCQALQGMYNHKFHYFQWRNLLWGQYLGFVQIYSRGELKSQSTVSFRVLGINEVEPPER